SVPTDVVRGIGNVDKMLEKFTGNIFVGMIVTRQFKRNSEHIETVHAHPTRAVRLLDVAPGRQRCGAIKDANIVQTQDAAFEDMVALGVFTVDPPVKIEQQLVEDAFKKGAVELPPHTFLDLVHAPRGPGVYRRVDIP